ncbi:MAG: zinc ribbon domain-containing protein [Promethearchaeota archaeon]
MRKWKPEDVKVEAEAEKNLNIYFERLTHILKEKQILQPQQDKIFQDLIELIQEYFEEEQIQVMTYEVSLKILDLLGSPTEFGELVKGHNLPSSPPFSRKEINPPYKETWRKRTTPAQKDMEKEKERLKDAPLRLQWAKYQKRILILGGVNLILFFIPGLVFLYLVLMSWNIGLISLLAGIYIYSQIKPAKLKLLRGLIINSQEYTIETLSQLTGIPKAETEVLIRELIVEGDLRGSIQDGRFTPNIEFEEIRKHLAQEVIEKEILRNAPLRPQWAKYQKRILILGGVNLILFFIPGLVFLYLVLMSWNIGLISLLAGIYIYSQIKPAKLKLLRGLIINSQEYAVETLSQLTGIPKAETEALIRELVVEGDLRGSIQDGRFTPITSNDSVEGEIVSSTTSNLEKTKEQCVICGNFIELKSNYCSECGSVHKINFKNVDEILQEDRKGTVHILFLSLFPLVSSILLISTLHDISHHLVYSIYGGFLGIGIVSLIIPYYLFLYKKANLSDFFFSGLLYLLLGIKGLLFVVYLSNSVNPIFLQIPLIFIDILSLFLFFGIYKWFGSHRREAMRRIVLSKKSQYFFLIIGPILFMECIGLVWTINYGSYFFLEIIPVTSLLIGVLCILHVFRLVQQVFKQGTLMTFTNVTQTFLSSETERYVENQNHTTQCPLCGYSVVADSMFCPNCGDKRFSDVIPDSSGQSAS